jgi:hypothetical protein
MSYNIHKLLALAEKFEKATKSLDKKKDKDEDKDKSKSGPKKKFPFWLKFKKKKVKSSLFDDLLLKYSGPNYGDPSPDEPGELTDVHGPDRSIPPVETMRRVRNNMDGSFTGYHSIKDEDQGGGGEKLQTLQDVIISGKKPNKYKSIDPKFQKLLGLNPDGILGPVTRSALDNYKKSIGQDGASDELAFIGMKNEPAYQTGTALVYDDNQNVYLSNFLAEKYKTNLPARKNPFMG